MFTVLRSTPIEYISLFDPAVDDDAMSQDAIAKYVETRDTAMLPVKPGCTPVTWVLYPLDPYTLRYAIGVTPRDPEGGLLPDMFGYHLTQVGLREARNLPPDAPELTIRKIGLLEKADDAFIRAIPPEIVRELGGVIYAISTVSEATRKNSDSPSGAVKSKGECTARPARSASR
jgi:hypothetical protein